MPIWAVSTVERQPEIELVQWSIMEIHPAGTRHFIGYNTADREGRVSSAIVEFDLDLKRGRTLSGRVYGLIGDSGHNLDAYHVFRCWCKVPGQRADEYRNVTIEVMSPPPSS